MKNPRYGAPTPLDSDDALLKGVIVAAVLVAILVVGVVLIIKGL